MSLIADCYKCALLVLSRWLMHCSAEDASLKRSWSIRTFSIFKASSAQASTTTTLQPYHGRLGPWSCCWFVLSYIFRDEHHIVQLSLEVSVVRL
jgi:hypothetical protein